MLSDSRPRSGTESKTILILYLSIGFGHRRAALALRDTLRELDPLARVVCLDIFEIWPAWIGRIIRRAYLGLIRISPGTWAYFYDNKKIEKRLAGPLQFLERACRGKGRWLLDEFSPAAVACTQAFPARLLAPLKREGESFFLVAVPTDYTVHAYWLKEEVDLYLAPSPEAARDLRRIGVSPDRVRVTGIPVHPSFEGNYPLRDLRRKYGLHPALPTVLLMSGGEGKVDLEGLILALDGDPGDFQILALSGRNLKLCSRLQRLRPRLNHHLMVLSFTDHVDELMEVADLLMTKAGGLTTAEALVKGLPMVLLSSLPGQEELNSRYLEGQGAALVAPGTSPAAAAAAKLLSCPELLAKMKKATHRLALPRAAREAARIIMELTDV